MDARQNIIFKPCPYIIEALSDSATCTFVVLPRHVFGQGDEHEFDSTTFMYARLVEHLHLHRVPDKVHRKSRKDLLTVVGSPGLVSMPIVPAYIKPSSRYHVIRYAATVDTAGATYAKSLATIHSM